MKKMLLVSFKAMIVGNADERRQAETTLEKWAGKTLKWVNHSDKHVRGVFHPGYTEIDVDNVLIDSPLTREKWIEGVRIATKMCRLQIKRLCVEAREISASSRYTIDAGDEKNCSHLFET